MNSPEIQNMTLRDKIRHANLLVRELTEHLEQGFVPKARSLQSTLRPSTQASGPNANEEVVSDKTVRDLVAELLTTETFTDDLYEKTATLLKAIDDEVASIVGG